MEKRKFVRVASRFMVWYQTIDENELSFGKPMSKNISAGGILLEMEEPLKVGTFLSLKFKLPDSPREILVKGKVVRMQRLESGKMDTGIEFSSIEGEDMEMLEKMASEGTPLP